MKIEEFLKQNIEGYLFCDVEKMLEIKLNKSENCGACGYPIMMTILSGMELLGFLLGNSSFEAKDGSEYFKNYWENYFCKFNKKYKIEGLDRLVRDLIRNGLAHSFMTKPNILIYKDSKESIELIDKERGIISFEVGSFFSDFKNSYYKFVVNDANKNNMQKRLDNMIKEYSNNTKYFFKNFKMETWEMKRSNLISGASVSVQAISPSGVFYNHKRRELDNY
ncbi:MAG: hypothetical protein WA055_00305 [Candidatus Moraniibacteriota bacterium]